ncbi:membrane hypothetical protein [Nostocoides japonicum T1-X7]|uniref:Integral membrane protein n=1 Tax=Nostocoides japonicum T1-X7 TaxID=1194083 RepID=A0A077M2E4_9MICO|nr:membrane hypothetical protein [Tetrasphaera japonica T1-X7]
MRALLALVVPVALLGPWGVDLVTDPVRLLGGPGLLAYGSTPPELLHLAALDPGGTAYPWYATLPVVGVGLLCLLRGRRRALPGLALGLLAVLGLAATLVAPRLRLGTVPVGMSGAGEPITPWWGLPMLVTVLALLALVLVGLSDLPMSTRRGGWTALLRGPVAAVVLVTAVGGLALHGWDSVAGLRAWTDPRPAVAVDQAEGGLANRSLLLRPEGSAMGYRLVAKEAPTLVRDLPTADARGAAQTAAVVRSVVDGTDAATVHGRLLTLGVGFVGVSSTAGEAIGQRLDATPGLVRMGSREGYEYWRVQPPAGAAKATAVGTPRMRLVSGETSTAVAVTGQHGATSASVSVPRAATLVVAQPAEWASRATVRAGDRVLIARTGSGAPTYAVPAGTTHLTVSVDPPHPWWRLGQLALLVLVLYLAVPTGRRTDPTSRRLEQAR